MTAAPEIAPIFQELKNIRYALDKSAIVAITDRAGTITYVNDKFCEISKYSRDELIGKNHRLINSGLHPKDFFVDLWKTISAGNIWVGEIRNRAKDGNYYWVHTTIVPLRGHVDEYISIRFEITNRKAAEEKLANYAQRLEVSNRELQDFASVAAHDLQEPLRKIHAFSDRLVTKYRTTLPEQAQDYLSRVKTSAHRMQILIDDLLTFSRITTRGQPFAPTALDTTINEVLSDLEIRIEQTNAKIKIARLPIIDADPLQMRQLFQNLISNAIKFHKKDVEPLIEIRAKMGRESVQIEVEDNGIGFEEKYLDRIFTIFQRLHGRTEYEGTGVGLAVCRRIIERHNGSITAKSVPDQGTTFILKLPVTQKKADL